MTKYKDSYEILYNEILNSGESFVRSYERTSITQLKNYKTLMLCGMGGSGISGDYVNTLNNNSNLEVIVSKNYELPLIENECLCIVISYSGNTEETINMLEQAILRRHDIIIVSSGGKMKKIADEKDLRYYELPTGLQPRVAFPYIFGTILGIARSLIKFEGIDKENRKLIVKKSNQYLIDNEEKINSISDKISRFMPIIISTEETKAVGTRFRSQLNENAKILAIEFCLPEFSHNGIVALDGNINKQISFILIPSSFQHKRVGIHFDYLMNDIRDKTNHIFELNYNTGNLLDELLMLTWITDYISVKVAEIQGIDPISVASIDKLKKKLSGYEF